MKKIYQKAQKCNNYEDYNRLHMIIDRYSHLKSNSKMDDLLHKVAQGKIKTNLSFKASIIKNKGVFFFLLIAILSPYSSNLLTLLKTTLFAFNDVEK